MSLLEEYVKAAAAGRNLWLSDLRAAFNAAGKKNLTLVLTMFSGEKRCFSLHIPEASGNAEHRLAGDYLKANIYNALSLLGCTELCLCYDREDLPLKRLAEEMRHVFSPVTAGYGRIIRELNRICRYLGKPDFRITEADSLPEEEFPPRSAGVCSGALSEKLVAAVEKAGKGIRVGIDVGGTDIKSALAVDGLLAATRVYDWNPAMFSTPEEMTEPILAELKQLLAGCGGRPVSIGISYPDVCIRDRICGGETPKTTGLRNNKGLDYEQAFAKIASLNECLAAACEPGAALHITNDGNIAAYTAAVEVAHGKNADAVRMGCFAHSLGTSLGSGCIDSRGQIPEIPLEAYDFLIDLGSYPQKRLGAQDIRSVLNEFSGLAGVDRYAGQASAFRYAAEIAPELLEGFVTADGGVMRLGRGEEDLRKPCLEHLMGLAAAGNPAAEEIFRSVGRAFGQVSREIIYYLAPEPVTRYVYGRFVKKHACFELIRRGFEEVLPSVALLPGDDSLANSPLMKQLAARADVTVAQFGQAIGALYFGCE